MAGAVVYGHAMADEEKETASSGAPHDGPDAGDSSQGRPGSANETDALEADPGREEPDPGPPTDTNERADSRATVVEPGGDEPSPRA